MYVGLYSSNVTIKNQLTFPSKFRELTGGKIFISQWFEKSLVILPHDQAEKAINEILGGSSSLIPEARDLERFLYSNARIVDLDKKNRFVIDKYLREYSRLGKKAIFVGVGERIELWDEQVYQNYRQIREMQIRETAISLYNRINQKDK